MQSIRYRVEKVHPKQGNREFGSKWTKTKRVFGPSCISDFPNTPLKILKEIRI